MSSDNSVLIIFAMIALIIFSIYIKHTSNNNEDNNEDNYEDNEDNNYDNMDNVDVSENYKKKRKRKSKKKTYGVNHKNVVKSINTQNKNKMVNKDFTDMQYHKDYYDTITAINNITSQKELFNMGFLPVAKTVPNPDNVAQLVDLFIKRINREIEINVSEYLHVNSGWSDMGKRRREKSGFEERMEELGLPGQIYNEPASKAKIELIKIDKAEQYNTDDQIRFVIHIIVQKKNVKDQMVLRLLFFMEKCDLSGNRDDASKFFERDLIIDNDKFKDDQVALIEQVFTVGYLSNDTLPKSKMDNFHNYDKVHRIDGTVDQSKVLEIMKRKHKERSTELNAFLCTLDDDTKEIHDVPSIGNYQSYKNTRTILDDLAKFPHRSFGDITI